MAGGYDIGVSGSSSSGASQSGALSANGGGFYAGPGPGSFVQGASGLNLSTPIVIVLAVAAMIVVLILFKRK